MLKKNGLLLIIALLWSVFPVFAQDLKTGPWRFELKTAYATVPFIAELEFNAKGRLIGKIFNGKETIELNNIIYRRGELSIPINNYEITMELRVESPTHLSGSLVRHNKNPKISTPIVANFGNKERYPEAKEKASIDLNGTWLVELLETDSKKSVGVITFKQVDDYVTGSILSPTGDFRFMEGYVSGDRFELASFDGVYNYAFKGTVKKGTLDGLISSASVTGVKGIKDEKAALPDPYAQTKLPSLKFIFPNSKGKHVNLNNDNFKNKVVVVQIFGSWCPNCLDEMQFLIPWYKKNSKRGVEIIALAFERSLSELDAKRQVMKTIKKFNIPYTVLIAGSTSEDKPMEKIVGLENFISFPTTIFLNKKHEVIKVHTGFNGPSTGDFFEKWKIEFNQTIDELLKQ